MQSHVERCPRCRIELRLLKKTAVQGWFQPVEAPPQVHEVPTVAADRYTDLGPLGRGGMGEVIRVSDPVLGRTVALKTMRTVRLIDPGAEARFIAEARMTAQLEHPGIVPVHALGRLADGRVFFTMHEVQGRTLGQVAQAVIEASTADSWRRTVDGWSMRRIVDAVRRVAEAVAFAHSRGVVHCDLKPANVMLGAWGEVLVLDWGVARSLDLRDEAGLIAGTPAYMAPEQARCESIGPQVDVYALGAILYGALLGRPPYQGEPTRVLTMVAAGEPPASLSESTRPVPQDLQQICARAMAHGLGDRTADARTFAQELAEWLDGAHKRSQALALVTEARSLAPKITAGEAEAEALDRAAAALLDSILPSAPVVDKRPAWQQQDRAGALRHQAKLDEVEMVRTLQAALRLDPDLPAAHRALADHHRAAHEAAEAGGDVGAALAVESLLRVHDRGEHARYLEGVGALTLHTDPPGAEVWCARFVERDRRLVVVDEATCLGQTPLSAVTLPVGSYQLTLRAPGCEPVAHPIEITRLGHWDGVAPGDSLPTPIRLPRTGELGPDECFVPAGWFRSGGDPEAASALSGQRLWCDAFIMRRFAVTQADFLVFLNALVDSGRAEEALRHAPREHGQGSWSDPGDSLYGRDASGHFFLQPDHEGDIWQPSWPVFLVDAWGAWAYARWMAERTGLHWRLPAELEWEKAARGTDGRPFPWGHHLDPTFTCMRRSHVGHALPADVTAYPTDTSPYGVRGLAGNMVDRCADPWEDTGPVTCDGRVVVPPGTIPAGGAEAYHTAKGGSWFNYPRYARAAWRTRMAWSDRTISVGFRLARSV